MLDIRMPIGLMFLIIGALLAVYGVTQSPAEYAKALGHNVDLYWGAAMAVFGLVMFAWMRIDPYHEKKSS
jgi:hypothetical protein